MNLLVSLHAEMLKTKRTSSFYLTIAAATFGPLMSMLDILLDDGIQPDSGKVIFNKMMTEKFQMTGFMVFPIFLMLICTLLPQIEYKNNTWKQVLTSPQTKGNIFFAKFINVQLLILVFLFTNQLMMLAGAVILHFKEPSLHVLNQPLDGTAILRTLSDSYISLLAICAIQFWLGLRFKNFIIPIALGIGLWFIGSIMVLEVKSAYAVYFPYSLHAYGSFPQLRSKLDTVFWTSCLYAIVFFAIGFLDFKRRRMNS
jgi:hypothetical protein